jgi:hypothetical protein
MTMPAPNEDRAQSGAAEGGNTTNADRDPRADKDPRATAHPTGEKQAAENAENETAG